MSYYLAKLRREQQGILGYPIGGGGSKSASGSESHGESLAESSTIQNATSNSIQNSIQKSNQGSNQSSSENASSNSQSFSGISDTDTLTAISRLIANEGMSSDLARQTVEKGQQRNRVLSELGNFTQNRAFENSTDAMSAALRTLSEHSGSAIARAVDSSGTSGGSMEALLSNDANARNAGAAAGIGVDLAAKYGDITANLLGNASGLSTIDSTSIDSLLKAIESMKIGTASSSSTSSGTSSGSSFGTSSGESAARSESDESSVSQSEATSLDDATSKGTSKSASFKLG